MPINIEFLEDDVDEVEITDIDSLDITAMGDLFIRYANTNNPQSIEEVFEKPVEDDGTIHPYLGFYIGIELPLEETIPFVFKWVVRDLTAIQNELNNLEITKQNKLNDPQMAAVNSGITETKVNQYSDHLNNIANPHRTTATQVGLGNVVNTGDSGAPVSGGTEKFTTGGAFAMQSNLIGRINDVNQSLNNAIIAEKNARTQKDNELNDAINTKQDELINKVNIKSINNQSILGAGNLVVKVDITQPLKDFTYDGVHTLEQVMDTKISFADFSRCLGYEIIDEEEEANGNS